jgi:glycosyltransferase involved in cell wall biosynthesis
MRSPAVTVLMPAFNAASFIRHSIRSILAQTFGDFELLVIDDGSADGTAEIVSSFRDGRIRLVRHTDNKGLVSTLNEGLRIASAPLVARMDADDVSAGCRLALQVDFLDSRDAIDAVGSAAMIVDQRGVPRGVMRVPSSPQALGWELCFRNPVPHCSVMMRRKRILDDYGGYPHSRKSEDYALWSEIAARNRFAMMTKKLVKYRVHGASIMRSDSDGNDISAVRRRNIRRCLGPILSSGEEEILARSWEDPTAMDWDEYCRVFEHAAAVFSRIHGPLGKAPGLQYQTLLVNSGQPVIRLISSLRRHAPRRLLRLPWARLLAARLCFGE